MKTTGTMGRKFSSTQYPWLLFPWLCDWKSGQHFKSWSPWKAQKPLKIKINLYRLCHNGFLVNRKTCLLFYPHTGVVVINYSTFGSDQKPEHDFIMLCLNELLNVVMNTQCGELNEFWTWYNTAVFQLFDQWTDFNVKSVGISLVL